MGVEGVGAVKEVAAGGIVGYTKDDSEYRQSVGE